MNVLQEADWITSVDRQKDYGHPRDDFGRTAQIWSAILGIPITAEQVGLCMIGVKLARQVHRPKRDNLIDVAGYARTLEMLAEVKTAETNEVGQGETGEGAERQ